MAQGATRSAGDHASSRGAAVDEPPDDLFELRRLLFLPEQEQLDRLQQRLDDHETRVAELSTVLPDAVRAGVTRGPALASALTPVVEGAIHDSVQRDPRKLVDAISPVMGPAIRRAIAVALSGMIQSLNEALETSVSWRGLLWRIEAARTGRPFAEVVLLHSLVYQVEHVFFIHKATGLLLQHVVAPAAGSPDASVVSAMLTAIQDFVNESFNSKGGGTLETMQVGDLAVWIEQGPLAVVVGVVRGHAPAELRAVLRETVERVHAGWAAPLEQFQGDAATFDACRPDLEQCLGTRYASPPSSRTSGRLAVVAGLCAVAAAFWLFTWVREGRRWNTYLDQLRTEPGIVLVSAERRGGRYVVSGLRDPLASDPGGLVSAAGLRPGDVVGRWEPYQSTAPRFVLARARALLAPPGSVVLAMDAGVLRLSGVAPHQWIADNLRIATLVPGVSEVRADQLLDQAMVAAEEMASRIDRQAIGFAPGSSALDTGQRAGVAALAADLRGLRDAARAAGVDPTVGVLGSTDETGSESINAPLAAARAERVVTALAAAGLPRALFAPSSQPAATSASPDGVPTGLGRRVTFRTRLARPAATEQVSR